MGKLYNQLGVLVMRVLRSERAFYIGRVGDKEMPFKTCEWLDKVNKGEGTQIFVCCLGCV